MTKRYCDICGKEMEIGMTTCQLTANTRISIIYQCNEVCIECIDKINDYIKTLNPKKDGD